jgi:hypothetical protein
VCLLKIWLLCREIPSLPASDIQLPLIKTSARFLLLPGTGCPVTNKWPFISTFEEESPADLLHSTNSKKEVKKAHTAKLFVATRARTSEDTKLQNSPLGNAVESR